MEGAHKFLRTRSGVTSFAIVRVDSRPSANWEITWNDSLGRLRDAYGSVVESGIQLAVAASKQRGGIPHTVEVVSIVEVPVDTRPDAVACAVAIATWKSLGGVESDVHVSLTPDGDWQVQF